MIADHIAQIIERRLDAIFTSEDVVKATERYNRADAALTTYLKATFLDFVETELVYQHAEQLCKKRQEFERWFRMYGFRYTRLEALRIWDDSRNIYYYVSQWQKYKQR